MVKGVVRHAVIVKSPDLKEFEQAIFILSDKEDSQPIKSPDEMLTLAGNLASSYCVKGVAARKQGRWLVPTLSFCAGSGVVAAIWWYLSSFGL